MRSAKNKFVLENIKFRKSADSKEHLVSRLLCRNRITHEDTVIEVDWGTSDMETATQRAGQVILCLEKSMEQGHGVLRFSYETVNGPEIRLSYKEEGIRKFTSTFSSGTWEMNYTMVTRKRKICQNEEEGEEEIPDKRQKKKRPSVRIRTNEQGSKKIRITLYFGKLFSSYRIQLGLGTNSYEESFIRANQIFTILYLFGLYTSPKCVCTVDHKGEEQQEMPLFSFCCVEREAEEEEKQDRDFPVPYKKVCSWFECGALPVWMKTPDSVTQALNDQKEFLRQQVERKKKTTQLIESTMNTNEKNNDLRKWQESPKTITQVLIEQGRQLQAKEDVLLYLLSQNDRLPVLGEEGRVRENEIRNCQFAIWMRISKDRSDTVVPSAYSESSLVRGILSLLLNPLLEKTIEEVSSIDWQKVEEYWPASILNTGRGGTLHTLIAHIRKAVQEIA